MGIFFAGTTAAQIFQLVFFAVVLYQLAYILLQILFVRRPEYYYYIIYMLCILPYFLSFTEEALRLPVFFTHRPSLKVYFDKPFIVLNFVVYTNFARHFLDIPALHPSFNKMVIRYMQIFTALGFVGLGTLYLTNGSPYITEAVFATFYTILFGTTLWIVYRFFKIRHSSLNNFILAGIILIVTGCLGSGILFVLKLLHYLPDNLLPTIPAQFMVMAELLVFTTGLGLKTRIIENEKIEVEKKLVTQLKEKEILRQQIAANLHDDVGATLSSISVYASVAKNSLNKGETGPAGDYLDRIYSHSIDMLINLREMVWAINPGNDSFGSLWDKMTNYAKPLLAAREIASRMEAESALFDTRLTVLQRRNLYLMFKEAISNIIRHADCNAVDISVRRLNKTDLQLVITDNGQGFDINGSREGIGINNLHVRTKELGGQFNLRSAPNEKTSISIIIPLIQN